MLLRSGRVVLSALVALIGCGLASASEPVITRVRLEGGGQSQFLVPLVRELPQTGPSLKAGSYRLIPEDGGQTLLGTVAEDRGSKILGFVLDALDAGQVRTFRLEPRVENGGMTGFKAEPELGGSLQVSVNGVPYTALRQGEFKPYFWPLLGPTGVPLTRAYPMENREGEDRDHPHQRSFWITHGNVNGVDFWASDPLNKPSPKFGKIMQKSLKSTKGGEFLRLATSNLWVNGMDQPVCEDEQVFTFWQLPNARIIDVEVAIRASWGPVVFGDTKEGTFGLRVPSALDVKRGQGGKIINAEGVTDQAAWGKPSPWVDYSGPVEGKTVGIAIFDHPTSFRHPTTWHVRDYGLFAANPFGYHDFGVAKPGAHTVLPGESLRLRYRVLLHEGDATQAGVATAYQGFAQPPAVSLLND